MPTDRTHPGKVLLVPSSPAAGEAKPEPPVPSEGAQLLGRRRGAGGSRRGLGVTQVSMSPATKVLQESTRKPVQHKEAWWVKEAQTEDES